MKFLAFCFTYAWCISWAAASENSAVVRLQKYLQIRTDHSNVDGPDYGAATEFLSATLRDVLPCATVRSVSFVSGKPVLIATVRGTEQSLPAVLLNSHMDVVPAEPDRWEHGAPFAADVVGGRVYARGAQDMKSVGLQYVEALGALCAGGWRPRRSVHISFVPDEEIGGQDGMKQLTKSALWKQLNVGVAVDEGLPNSASHFNVYKGERQTWSLKIVVDGAPGHAATMPASTAAQTVHGIIGRALEFRETQLQKVTDGAKLGDVVSVNVVFMDAGIRAPDLSLGYVGNVIPSAATVGINIRVPPSVPKEEMDKEVERWVTCDGKRCDGVRLEEPITKDDIPFVTDLESNTWYAKGFFDGMKEAGFPKEELEIGIFPASTDIRYVRNISIPAIGFSPIRNTPDLLHKHNEFISVDGYLEGVEVYKSLIKNLADSVPEGAPKSEL